MDIKLLNKEELAWSATVANNSMNRTGKAVGINSYQKDLIVNPIEFLLERKSQKEVRWLDLCCGEGNALIQTAELLDKEVLLNHVELEGIDLVDFFSDSSQYPKLILRVQSLEDWIPQKEFDLITIVHGLHYIGDKIGLITKSISLLKPDGRFEGNLDVDNIKITNVKKSRTNVFKFFRQNDIMHNPRRKIISSVGKKIIKSDFHYLGADDKAGPNYTGQ